MRTLIASTLLGISGIALALAHQNEVNVTHAVDQICIRSNGLPNHDTGTFPNRGNPHRLREQDTFVCVPSNPVKNAQPTRQRGTVGIAVNGVLIRPGTADWYDAASPRGHSRDRSSGWNLEGMGSAEKLGIDHSNAHVDHRGIYHYHGVPSGLLPSLSDSMIGWAADGFELHLASREQTSSWQLKPGTRPTPPYGQYDGQFEQDWEHAPGSGTLDECNAGMLDGRFVYFVTEAFPFYPRCLWGDASPDFAGPGEPRDNRNARNSHRHGHGPLHRHRD